MKKKKIPLRKCIACGEGKPKKELIRVVRNNEKEVSIDITGKMNGRGAYICSNLECLELAQKGKKLSRTLEVEVPNDVYESLKNIIQPKLGK
ncbi:YlxR family protein [Tissierella carlieri]|uniref:YlxR family protein n=1 Tax=Tissierella carlieri TaxID=689904 RepID=A0ABT1S6V7_9FIRM|nr:YlxR family protein [Tissierella carlieri]MCQ4921752.1 YlxR family protein [Tissierella carlieri]